MGEMSDLFLASYYDTTHYYSPGGVDCSTQVAREGTTRFEFELDGFRTPLTNPGEKTPTNEVNTAQSAPRHQLKTPDTAPSFTRSAPRLHETYNSSDATTEPNKAKDFGVTLDDVSITELPFNKRYAAAVETKQIAGGT